MKNKWKNNIGYKILAFVFAAFLWWMVVNVDDPIDVKQYDVDVIVTNPEVITNSGQSFQVVENTKSVTVTVKARRKVLAEIKGSHIMATADLREKQGNAVPVRISISGFEGEYEEANANPRNIQVKVENTIKKTFPITAMATGKPRAGYVVGTLSPEPKTVDVSGPESIIKKISKVVAKVDVSEISVDKEMETKLTYYDAADNELDKIQLTSNCDKNGVSVYVDLWKTKEVPLKFNTSALKTAKGYAVARLEVEPEKVEIYTSPDMMDSITEVVVGRDALKLSGLTENEEVIVKISEYLPEGILLADSDADNIVVRIIVEKSGTKKVELATESIEKFQLSDKLQCDYNGVVKVEIEISGSKEQLEKIVPEQVKGIIDLKDYTKEGTYDVPISVKGLPENCSVEGTVTIRLKKK
jgi:YbbR domain-containing protein